MRNEGLKHTIIDAMERLEDYPVSLREMDVAEIKGLKKNYTAHYERLDPLFNAPTHDQRLYLYDRWTQ